MIVAQRSMQYTRGLLIAGRDPNLGCVTLHSMSQNILNLDFKFAIFIRQNKCDHLGHCFMC